MDMRIYEELSQATDLETFRRKLLQAAAEMDFSRIYLFIGSKNLRGHSLMEIHNVPEAFREASVDPVQGKRDPVLNCLTQGSIVPFTYDQNLYVANGAADLWDHQAAFGYQCGIALSTWMPDDRFLWIGVDRDVALPQGEKLVHAMAALQLLAAHAQAAAQTILRTTAAPAQALITHTEREILRWVCEKKTSWEIGRIMRISENTINWHVANVLRKLDCRSRLEAALLSKSLGLL